MRKIILIEIQMTLTLHTSLDDLVVPLRTAAFASF